MTSEINLRVIVSIAKEKGYFDLNDYPKLRLSPQEMLQLMGLLSKSNIPFGLPEKAEALSPKNAHEIIDALRRGTPSPHGVRHYSVGRKKLLTQIEKDLDDVMHDRSIVRFLNADIGQGKTHALYLLREFAFKKDFAVSIVTLSQNSCPLNEFMAVYHAIMWGLRTSDQPAKPALSNIFDRWVNDIRLLDEKQIIDVVENKLPISLREIMAAYVDTTNLLRPNEIKRQQILKYLSGEKMSKKDIKPLGINFSLNSDNALLILSEMAATIRFIGFKGICILFDEAESIHSFARSSYRDQAYDNLRQIIQHSQRFPYCYFLYATTPSFMNSYDSSWVRQLTSNALLELDPLNMGERQDIGEKITEIYTTAYGWKAPPKIMNVIYKAAKYVEGVSIGDFIRQVIGILDETRGRIE
jgi:hypothetical protein